MSNVIIYDYVIIGGGIVGLSVAHQLLEKNNNLSIAIIDKESAIGRHSSGRNSGVLHAGLYYKPESIRAKVCVQGAHRLKEFVKLHGLEINNCGKVIVPQSQDLDSQLDLLANRGRENGAIVQFINEKELKKIMPCARTSSGRALWSPNTSVVNPKEVLKKIVEILKDKGVTFMHSPQWHLGNQKNYIKLDDLNEIYYDHLINCAGLNADKVAHRFGVGLNYALIPFKGIYWQIKEKSLISLKQNLYPVPDLSVPFLGVHFTPSVSSQSKIYIGPTATLAFGRENYKFYQNIEPQEIGKNIKILIDQYLNNKNGFRKYVQQQAFLSFSPLMLREAKKLIPTLTLNDIEKSSKIGIRPQLFDKSLDKLEDDFVCINEENSTHVMNSISPAFTASFALADYIIQKMNQV